MISKIKFQKTIWDYYSKNKREFPWRNTSEPYKIWVSEVMLQQTQTFRVVPKYKDFIQRFPDFKSLAHAPFPEVLTFWSGLGYNKRALYLQKSARKIIKDFGGKLPSNPKVLETFPGIGKATASSILVFSMNLPLIFIETNIRRVFIHFFFTTQEKVSDQEILKLIEQTLETKNPREFYWALMDYGTMLGRKKINPNIKSNHYLKQSSFKTSVRKIRGEILKLLLKHKILNKKELQKKLNNDPKMEKALSGLEKDQIITIQKEIVQIKKY